MNKMILPFLIAFVLVFIGTLNASDKAGARQRPTRRPVQYYNCKISFGNIMIAQGKEEPDIVIEENLSIGCRCSALVTGTNGKTVEVITSDIVDINFCLPDFADKDTILLEDESEILNSIEEIRKCIRR